MRPSKAAAEEDVRECTRVIFNKAAIMLNWADLNHPDSRVISHPETELEFTQASQAILDQIVNMAIAYVALQAWRDESPLA